MRLPIISGVIDRRILINYRVIPAVLAAILPAPFRPQIVGGFGLAGICLIRLRAIRPRGCPRWLGLASENAAHRVAVEWEHGGQVRCGVYVLRRDTNSRLNALAGGRMFPGLHHRGRFRVREDDPQFAVEFQSVDGRVSMEVVGHMSDCWPRDSVFSSLAEASSFFEAGSLGYSPTTKEGRFEGLELRCHSWDAKALAIQHVHSSLFDDERLFPRGTIERDCGLVMRGIEHEWRASDELCCCQLGVPNTEHSVLSTQYSVLSQPTSCGLVKNRATLRLVV
jgi:hypothetical protein